MVELKLIEDLIEKILETYTRYSGVDDEEQKKKVFCVFNDCFLRNLVEKAIAKRDLFYYFDKRPL